MSEARLSASPFPLRTMPAATILWNNSRADYLRANQVNASSSRSKASNAAIPTAETNPEEAPTLLWNWPLRISPRLEHSWTPLPCDSFFFLCCPSFPDIIIPGRTLLSVLFVLLGPGYQATHAVLSMFHENITWMGHFSCWFFSLQIYREDLL